jgi:DNA-binding MarR family transcriptional regulator
MQPGSSYSNNVSSVQHFMPDDFPDDVKEFIGKNIHSIAQLEVLLMLQKQPERTWTVDEITSRLYLQSEMVAHLLNDIVQRGFAVEGQGQYRYQPASDADNELVERLNRVYQERRVAVTTEIFSKPIDFVKAFADAFRLRKEK